jgi:hypothetical protein
MLADTRATVLLSASDLAAILKEVRSLREELEELRASVAEERARDRRRITALETPPHPTYAAGSEGGAPGAACGQWR